VNLSTSLAASADERKAIRAQIEAVNKSAAENWQNPKWRAEMAQAVTETIQRGFDHENLLSMMTTVENAPFDGRVFVKEVRGLRAYWVARGGYIEASTMRQDVMEIPRDTIGFHVMEFEDKLITNFAETQSTLINLGIQRLDAEVNRSFVTLLQAAIPNTSPYYITGSGVSLASLNLALRQVRDSVPLSGQPNTITIVGRGSMTEQLIDAIMGPSSNGSGFLPQTNEQLLSQGVIGNYRGCNIITLRNYLDDSDTSFFPANELYVVGNDASKFAWWGDLMAKQFDEADNWYWHYLARRDFGGVVIRPDRMRRIIDTATAP